MTKVRFGVLGPLQVGTTSSNELGSLKRQVLIAMLVRSAGRPVAPQELVTAIWQDQSQGTGNNVLHWHIHKVRQVLDDPKRLELRDGGYILKVGPGESDVSDFEAGVEAGSHAVSEENWTSASQHFIHAEELWRGSAYEGLGFVPELQAEAVRLSELRFTATEHRFTADLNLGRHEQIIPELAKLVKLHPFRDGLRGRLMLALYRCGRQADALGLYRHGRELSIERLGLELGPELGQLERDILNQVPSLSAPKPSAVGRSRQSVPFELPRSSSKFTGLGGQADRIRTALLENETTVSSPIVVSGIAGSGKSTLAVHVARQVSRDFPDGQLYADLAGNVGGPAVTVEDILSRFLRSLGSPSPLKGLSRDELAARFRTMTADRRVLILVDNVSTISQVRHLLPAAGTSAVLITGRRSLAGLTDTEHVTVPMLSETESVELLSRIVGVGRVARERAMAAVLAGLCGYHPLALSIIAARLKARPDWRLESLVRRLQDPANRGLDEFVVNDWSLRARFDTSFDTLSSGAATMFGLLGTGTQRVFTAQTAAALARTGVPDADAAMDELTDSGLMSRLSDDSYQMPGLVHRYAHELAVRLNEAERPADAARLQQVAGAVAEPLTAV